MHETSDLSDGTAFPRRKFTSWRIHFAAWQSLWCKMRGFLAWVPSLECLIFARFLVSSSMHGSGLGIRVPSPERVEVCESMIFFQPAPKSSWHEPSEPGDPKLQALRGKWSLRTILLREGGGRAGELPQRIPEIMYVSKRRLQPWP